MSAIVHIRPEKGPKNLTVAALERLTQAAFGQRRKMLRQNLKIIPKALDCLADLDISPTRRAETLSVADYVALAQAIETATG